jgi:hypothetical protein
LSLAAGDATISAIMSSGSNEKMEQREGFFASIAGCCGTGFRYPTEFKNEHSDSGMISILLQYSLRCFFGCMVSIYHVCAFPESRRDSSLPIFNICHITMFSALPFQRIIAWKSFLFFQVAAAFSVIDLAVWCLIMVIRLPTP